MKVTLTCTLEELDEMRLKFGKHFFKGSEIRIVRSNKGMKLDTVHQQRRRDIIKELIVDGETHKQSTLYQRARIKGYPARRRTFQRDVEHLEKEGCIEIGKIGEGSAANHNTIRKK